MGSLLNPNPNTGSVPPPSTGGTNTGSWYTPTNTYLPPGVDPYYGVSIVDLANMMNTTPNSSGTDTVPAPTVPVVPSPTPQTGMAGGKGSGTSSTTSTYKPSAMTSSSRPTGKDKNGKITMKELQKQYDYDVANNIPIYGRPGSDASQDGGLGGTVGPYGTNQDIPWYPQGKPGKTKPTTDVPGVGGAFRIARPNMTWINNLPSVMPAGGQAMLDQYGPSPYTIDANTPNFNYTPRQLTYNNPYNTNPYLPTANPFALIANTPTSGS